jgi:hypothetical protein
MSYKTPLQINRFTSINKPLLNTGIYLKTGGIVKNRKSRDTGNSGHKTQIECNKTKIHNIEIKKYEKHGPYQKMGVNPGAREK